MLFVQHSCTQWSRRSCQSTDGVFHVVVSSVDLVDSLLSWNKQKVNKKIQVEMFDHISLSLTPHHCPNKELALSVFTINKRICEILKGLISESLTVNSLILVFLTAQWWIKGINCTMFSFLTASDCVIETNVTYREMKTKTRWDCNCNN